MPTIITIGKYRFFFFSNEGGEPVHIHVESGDDYAKFWLGPIQLAKSIGFSAREINSIRKMVEENEMLLKEKWDEYFHS